MGRGLRTDLGDTAIFTSGKEEKSVKETGREGAGGGEEMHENVIFWKPGEARISRRKGPDSMLLRNPSLGLSTPPSPICQAGLRP